MSEVKVNKITPTTNCGTVTLGDSGDTLSIPCGATLSNAGSITNSGTITNTGTISGGTITGTIDNQVNWDTTAKTANFTAVAGNGYFVNTTSGAITVTLPASPTAGDLVGIKDYANTADTNNITIARNGENIQGTANDFTISTEGLSIILIYVDGTQGWVSTGAAKASDIAEEKLYVTATGGTVTCCGDYKIHTFTGPGTFCVSCAGNSVGSNTVEYLVVGGGASGTKGAYAGPGGGGACVSTATGLPVSVTAYPIAVGGGGTNPNGAGTNSVFSIITAYGGGANPAPPTSTAQSGNGLYLGNTGSGGNVNDEFSSGGGGDAGPSSGRTGGPGTTSSLTGSPVVYAAGGGGGAGSNYGPGGAGSPNAGAGAGGPGSSTAGVANTGSGGGGGNCSLGGGPGYSSNASNGGSGVVAIKYKFQN